MSIKIGVFGGRRGDSMINWCSTFSTEAEIVAICEKDDTVVKLLKSKYSDKDITYYSDFDDFINHDMDGVVLANYANEHAPYAVRCLTKGLNVLSEVLPCQTLSEAVALVEAVEKSGKIYAYAENYCYMPAPLEMKRLYREGKLGEFEYGEGEYIHNCEPIWDLITYGEKDHWRNNMHANFYCTHSIGPLLHITGLRPVKVSGFELPFNNAMARMGAKKGSVGMEIITLENGAVIKSIHGDLRKNNIWFFLSGTLGRMESVREAMEPDGVVKICTDFDEKESVFVGKRDVYEPMKSSAATKLGHVGSDFYSMHEFIAAINGKKADVIGVYEALDMSLPGIFAYFSVLDGGVPKEIPDLRDKKVRDAYRRDTRCTDPAVAGDMLLPSYSKGNPEIPDFVYEQVRKRYEIHTAEQNKKK